MAKQFYGIVTNRKGLKTWKNLKGSYKCYSVKFFIFLRAWKTMHSPQNQNQQRI